MEKPTLAQRLMQQLVKGGLSQRKAKELAGGLAQTARRTIQRESKTETAPKPPTVLPVTGAARAPLMAVMDGYSYPAGYRVVAVKGEDALIAVRRFGLDSTKVKFYPTMEAWGFSFDRLAPLGATSLLKREPYERVMMTDAGLEQLLERIGMEAKPKRRSFKDRLLAVAFAALQKVSW